MATYRVKTPRGSYDVQVPEGTSEQDVYRTVGYYHPDAFTPLKDSPVGDTLSYLKQGAATFGRSVASVGGADNSLANFFERQGKNAEFSEAEQARQKRDAEIRKAAEGKGAVQQGLAALHAFAIHPQAAIGQTVGTLAAPVGLAGAAGLAAATAPVSVPGALLAGGLTAAGATLGLAAGAGGVKMAIYDAVKEGLAEHNVDPKKAEEAAQRAQEYLGPNGEFIAGGALVGMIDKVTGVGGKVAGSVAKRVAAQIATKGIAEETAEQAAERVAAQAAAKGAAGQAAGEAAKKSALKGYAADVAKEAATGAGFMGLQKVGTNTALSNAGVPTDPLKGVAGEAVYGGLTGVIGGATAGGVLHGYNRKTEQLSEILQQRQRDADARAIAAGPPGAKGVVPDADHEAAVVARAQELAAGKRGMSPALFEDIARTQVDAERDKAADEAAATAVVGKGPRNRGGAAAATAADAARAQADTGRTEPVVSGDRGADAARAAVAEPAGAERAGVEPAAGTAGEHPVGAAEPPAPLTPKQAKENTIAEAAAKAVVDITPPTLPAVVEGQPAPKVKPPTKVETTSVLKDFTEAHGLDFPVPPYLRDKVHEAVKEAAKGGETLHPVQALAEILGPPAKAASEKVAEAAAETPSTTDAQKASEALSTSAETGTPVKEVIAEPKAEAPPAEAPPAEAPPVEAAPAEAPPVEAPPVEAAPAEAAPAEAAPAEAAPAEAAPAEAVPEEVPVETAAEPTVKGPPSADKFPAVSRVESRLAEVAAGRGDPPPSPEMVDAALDHIYAAIKNGERYDLNTIYDAVKAAQPAAEPLVPSAEAPPVEAPVEAAAPAPTEPQPSATPEAPGVQEAVPPPETGAEAAPAPVEGAPAPQASEAAPAAEPVAAPQPQTEAAAPPPEVTGPTTIPPELEATPQDHAAEQHGMAQAEADLKGEPEPPPPDLPPQAPAELPPVAETADTLENVNKVQQDVERRAALEGAVGGRVTVDEAKEKLKLTEDTDKVTNDPEGYEDGIQRIGLSQWLKVAKPIWDAWLRAANSSSLMNFVRDYIPNIDQVRYLNMMARGYRHMLITSFDEFGQGLHAFVSKHGDEVFGAATRITRRLKVDILAHDNVEDALRFDPVMRKVNALLRAGVKQTKGGKDSAEYTNALTKREAEIREAYKIRDQLAAQEGGLEMYRDLLNFHRDMRAVMTSLRNKFVEAQGISDPKEVKKLQQYLDRQLDPSTGRVTASGMDGVYRMVQASAMPDIYFPAKRYGNYWLSVKDPEVGRQFYMFDTHKELRDASAKMANIYGRSEGDTTIFDRGDNSKRPVSKEMVGESAALREAFETVDKFTFTGKDEAARDVQRQQLRDAIFQTFLHTMPDRSLSKRLIHFEDVIGASHDVLRDFGSTAKQLTSQLTLMKYGPEYTKLQRSLQEYLRPPEGPHPFDAVTRERLDGIVNTLLDRLQNSINPPAPNKWASNLNRFAVVYYMSSAASALANMTIMAVRVWPRLVRDHGMLAATRKAISYMNYMDKLKIDVKFSDGRLRVGLPSMKNTTYVGSNPHLKWGMEWADRRGLFHTAYDMQVDEKPSFLKGSVKTPQQRAMRFGEDVVRVGTKALTVGLSASESISREHAFMMGYELQLAKELKAGKGTLAEQRERAAKYAAKTLDETVGNPDAFESPKEMGQGFGRVLGLFKRFSLQTVNFFYGNIYSAAKAFSRGDTRVAVGAISEMGMVIGVTALLAGMRGLPLYNVITDLIDLWDDKHMSQEEKDIRAHKYGIAAPSLDMRLNYVDLPHYFNGGTMTGFDGFQHSFANAIMNGPLPELSDISFGPRVSLNGLFFRGKQAGDNLPEVISNTIGANIAGFAAPQMVAKGVEDMDNGEYLRGWEKMLPAGLKGVAQAWRFHEEGAMTTNQKVMLARESFTNMNLLSTIGGAPPTKLYTLQYNKSKIAEQIKNSGTEKNALLDQLKSSVAHKDRERFMTVLKKMQDFDRRYPYPGIAFTAESIENSMKSSLKDRKASISGTTVSRKAAPYMMETVLAGRPVPSGAPGY